MVSSPEPAAGVAAAAGASSTREPHSRQNLSFSPTRAAHEGQILSAMTTPLS
jgi:hypothetical protein